MKMVDLPLYRRQHLHRHAQGFSFPDALWRDAGSVDKVLTASIILRYYRLAFYVKLRLLGSRRGSCPKVELLH